jgi:hypothetical protein
MTFGTKVDNLARFDGAINLYVDIDTFLAEL